MNKNYLISCLMLFWAASLFGQDFSPWIPDTHLKKGRESRNVFSYIEKKSESKEAITPLAWDESIIFSEDFEGDFPPVNWTILDEDGDGSAWYQDNVAWAYEGDHVARSDSWSSIDGDLNPDNWLITPQISLPVTTSEEVIRLEFYMYIGEESSNKDFLEVYISTTGNDPSDFISIFDDSPVVTPYQWRRMVVNISQYNGEDVYIAFRHHNSSGIDLVALDQVQINHIIPKDNDISLYSYYVGEYVSVPSFINYEPQYAGAIRNVGKNLQTNIYLNVTSTHGFNENSSTFSQLNFLDIRVFNIDFTPPTVVSDYDVTLTAHQSEVDEDLSDNTASESLSISSGIYIKDKGVYSGSEMNVWMGNGNNYSVGNFFPVRTSAVAAVESATFAVAEDTDVGTPLTVSLWRFNSSTNGYDQISSSSPYEIQAADISTPGDLKFVTVKFSSPYQIQDGDDLIVAVDHNSASNFDFYFINSQKLPGAINGLVNAPGITNGWNELSGNFRGSPIVRMDIRECVNATHTGQTDPTCHNGSDGEIELSITLASTATYTVSWTGASSGSESFSGTDFTIENLVAGTYQVTLSDENNCEVEFSDITLANPDPFDISLNATNASDCSTLDGEIEVTVIDPTTVDYTVAWTGAANGSNTFSGTQITVDNLVSGDYTIVVTDDDGCEVEKDIEVEEDVVEISINLVSEVSCSGKPDAVLEVVSDDNLAGYTFTWNTAETGISIEVGEGDYDVIGNNGACNTNSASISVADGELLILAIELVSALSCEEAEDAVIAVISDEDISSYTFTWSNLDTGDTITVGAGSYSLTSSGECNTNTPEIEVEEGEKLPLTIEVVNLPSCQGADDATLTVISDFDISDYSFTWSTEETGDTIFVEAGAYTVSGSGICVTTIAEITVEDGDPLEISINLINLPSCAGADDALIEVISEEDISDYEFTWSTEEIADTIAVKSGTYSVSGLGYCVTTTPEITVAEGDSIVISIQILSEPTCAGASDAIIEVVSDEDISEFTFTWSTTETTPSIEVGSGNYSVSGHDGTCLTTIEEVDVPDGVASIIIEINQLNEVSCLGAENAELVITSENEIENLTFTWSNDDEGTSIEVGAGTYSVFGTDGFCNTNTVEFTVEDGDEILIDIIQTATVICAGDETAVIEITSDNNLDGFVFTWNTTETGLFIQVGGGDYSVAGDDGICTTNTAIITVEDGYEINLDGTVNGTHISTSVSGHEGELSYLWEGPDGFTSEEADITVDANGNYTVTVTDENGCQSSATFTVNDVSVGSYQTSAIKVYPIPASSELIFDFHSVSAKTIIVYEISGRMVETIDVRSKSFIIKDVQNYASGMYIYRIVDTNGQQLKSDKFNIVR
jgi:hypothetical protein